MIPEDVVPNQPLRSVLGSITAGALAGYVSHVPHNLSTLKLLKPTISYGSHFQSLVDGTVDVRLKKQGALYQNQALRRLVGTSLVFLLPKGVMLRTAQIVGSFVIVNGTISIFEVMKVEDQLAAYASGTPKIAAVKTA